MRDNRSSNQNNGSRRNAPSDWEASSRWFEERQSRITTGSYSQSQQNSRPAAQRQDGNMNNRSVQNKKQEEKKQSTKSASTRNKKKSDKERQKFNRYYNKNKNSGKSKDELRREFAMQTKRRRKRKVFEALFFTLLIAIGIFVALSLTVLFKIETVSVTGDTRYSQEQIIEAAQVEIGDNLWLTTSGKLTAKAAVALPYVKEVKVLRSIPSDIVLEVSETTPKYSIKTDGKYALIDESGKVLEVGAKKKGNTTLLAGIEFEELVPGMPLKLTSEENYNLAMEIISFADKNEINLTKIDVGNVNLITAIYNSKIRLEFGAGTDLEAKVKMAGEIINKLNEEKNTQEGVINLKSVTKAFFREESLNPTTTQPATEAVTDENGNPVETTAVTTETTAGTSDGTAEIATSANSN